MNIIIKSFQDVAGKHRYVVFNTVEKKFYPLKYNQAKTDEEVLADAVTIQAIRAAEPSPE